MAPISTVYAAGRAGGNQRRRIMKPTPNSGPRPSAAQVGAGPLITASALSVAFGERSVLDHIDLAVSPAEIMTVIGPNGSGKTTLVRALLGLVPLRQGAVKRRPGLRIGYVPQRMNVDRTFPLTVTGLMRLTARPSVAEIREALAFTGAEALAEAQISRLSGGELQRILLARAILRKPHLLVLDEPVQNVDFAGEAELYRLIGRIRDTNGCGILMISHDLHLVMAATDQVICLNRHICCAGEPALVCRHPEFLRLFGPQAANTHAVYEHIHDHTHSTSGDVVPLTDTE